ncbi:hypothetical protein, partial [Klebsiella pneumoniae]|uniref:hypothetical protein n=1 Tax=Klebsiella pneumoniae TaxID=573 RepID=UPI0025A25E27
VVRVLALSCALLIAGALPVPAALASHGALAAQGSPRTFRLKVRSPQNRDQVDSSQRMPEIVSRAVIDTSKDVNFRALAR